MVTQINRKQLVVLIIIVKPQLFPLSLCGGLSLGKAITDQNIAFVGQLLDLISGTVVDLGIAHAINRVALNRLTSILINVIDLRMLWISRVVDVDHNITFLRGRDLIFANHTVIRRVALDRWRVNRVRLLRGYRFPKRPGYLTSHVITIASTLEGQNLYVVVSG